MNAIPNKAGNTSQTAPMKAAAGGAGVSSTGESPVNSMPTAQRVSNNHPGNNAWREEHFGSEPNSRPSIPKRRSMPRGA